jgi:hypothetical protein
MIDILFKLFNDDHHDKTDVDLFQMKIDWLKKKARIYSKCLLLRNLILTFLKIKTDCNFI